MRSAWKLYERLRLSEKTIHIVVKKKLILSPFKFRIIQVLLERSRKNLSEKYAALLRRAARCELEMTVFSDELLFYVEQTYTAQRTRILTYHSKESEKGDGAVSRTPHSQGERVCTYDSSSHRTRLLFVNKQAESDTNDQETDISDEKVLPWSKCIAVTTRCTYSPTLGSRRIHPSPSSHFPSFVPSSKFSRNSSDGNSRISAWKEF